MNKPWESNIAKGTVKGKLTIGLMISDGIVDPHPSIVRSLQETARALEAAGHKVIPWEPPSHQEILEVTFAMYFLDGGNKLRALLKEGDEPPLTLLGMALSLSGTQRSLEQCWEVSCEKSFIPAINTQSNG